MILMDMPRSSLRAHLNDRHQPDFPSPPRPMRRDYERGEQVLRAGGSAVPCVLISGALRIDRPGSGPENLQLAWPGDLVGLEALHGWSPTCDVRALVDSEIAPLRRMSDTEWRDVLLNALLRRQSQGASLGKVRAGSASERVRRLLLMLAGVDEGATASRAGDTQEPIVCELPSLADMSAVTMTASETVSRVVSSLRRSGLLADHGHRRVRLASGLLLEGGELPVGMTRSRIRD
ncbi:putative transcriptional regulator, Crp/Fnr family [Leptothrix cholodnii SP-6]|uniref:Putative transcriptional regulator, Crp/Fnr family n=1 Tax=Leptothrix cholodnii (strain ATCC 51168 / LMG 8142 / SP-6) TaxID=395495 RepID=B1Y1G5_LEPCP|nr:Crp/Fnr family transcriptional regulator [Leptothrix cholodnii]ACB34264.1 putative transcriptional regulator, Crp/Fnr family [Leptothrix cholodnii SP-6]